MKAVKYKLVVGGKRMTVIDTTNESQEECVKGFICRFGRDRIDSIKITKIVQIK